MLVNLMECFDNCDRGWQQSTINGSALLKWQNHLGLEKDRDSTLIGFINAAPWLSGSFMYVSLNSKPIEHDLNILL